MYTIHESFTEVKSSIEKEPLLKTHIEELLTLISEFLQKVVENEKLEGIISDLTKNFANSSFLEI